MSRPFPLTLLALTLAMTQAACGQSPAVSVLRYTGELRQIESGGRSTPIRSFSMQAWVKDSGLGREIISLLEDEGRGGHSWEERVGAAEVSGGGDELSGFIPTLRHVHVGRSYDLQLPAAVFPSPAPLEEVSEWRGEWHGRPVSYSVEGEKRVGARECWEVHAEGDVGRAQTLMVEKLSQRLVSAECRVFMGQGDRFDLNLKLEDEQPLAGDEAAAAWTLASSVLELKSSESPAAGLADLKARSAGTPWERFVTTIENELATTQQRAKSMAALAGKILGQPAPEFQLTGLDGRAVDRSLDEGKVVVLHFWEYQGEPESPFGQVGFLDFLASQRKQDDVRVYGVAVDGRAGDPQQQAAVQRAVRKFSTQFMRLGYPVTLDDGTLLAKFGDPRPLDAPLPLWIVIGPDGKVAAHHSGLYDLDPNRGLEELNAAVSRAREGK